MYKDISSRLESIAALNMDLAAEREALIDDLDSAVSSPVFFDAVEISSGDDEGRYADLLASQVREVYAEVSLFGGLVEYDTPLYPVSVQRDRNGFLTVTCRFFVGRSLELDVRVATVSIYDVVNPESVADFVVRFSHR